MKINYQGPQKLKPIMEEILNEVNSKDFPRQEVSVKVTLPGVNLKDFGFDSEQAYWQKIDDILGEMEALRQQYNDNKKQRRKAEEANDETKATEHEKQYNTAKIKFRKLKGEVKNLSSASDLTADILNDFSETIQENFLKGLSALVIKHKDHLIGEYRTDGTYDPQEDIISVSLKPLYSASGLASLGSEKDSVDYDKSKKDTLHELRHFQSGVTDPCMEQRELVEKLEGTIEYFDRFRLDREKPLKNLLNLVKMPIMRLKQDVYTARLKESRRLVKELDIITVNEGFAHAYTCDDVDKKNRFKEYSRKTGRPSKNFIEATELSERLIDKCGQSATCQTVIKVINDAYDTGKNALKLLKQRTKEVGCAS